MVSIVKFLADIRSGSSALPGTKKKTRQYRLAGRTIAKTDSSTMHQFFHASLPVRNNNSNSYWNKVSFLSFVSANIEISFHNSKWIA